MQLQREREGKKRREEKKGVYLTFGNSVVNVILAVTRGVGIEPVSPPPPPSAYL